jgi:hypothetical protein
MSDDTTVRISRDLIILMKHLAISRDTTLKGLIEDMIREYARKELMAVREKNPLLYAVIMAEEVEPERDEVREIEEEQRGGPGKKRYSLAEVRKELRLK